jgi:hypothetical protein
MTSGTVRLRVIVETVDRQWGATRVFQFLGSGTSNGGRKNLPYTVSFIGRWSELGRIV